MDHTVSIRTCRSDTRDSLEQSLDDIGGLRSVVSGGDRVLLKPNINGTECVTSLKVVDALLELLHDHSVTDVAIAEATFGDERTTQRCFASNGYVKLAERWGIDLINLNASDPVELPVPDPLVTDTVRVAREVVEADCLINVPVMKVHYATGITLCLKNIKGVLVGPEKRRFHEIGLDKAIADLNRVVSPDLNVVDATTCMERMGPRGGDLVEMNLVLTGRQSVYVDAIGSQVMGFKVEEIGHLVEYCRATGVDPASAFVVGESVESISRPFRRVDLTGTPAHTAAIRNSDACSSCVNALILSLMSCEGADLTGVEFRLGSTHPAANRTDDCTGAAGRTVAFGRCAITTLDDPDVIVPGCPPYPFELRSRL